MEENKTPTLWVRKKTPRFERVQMLLATAEETNQYTNGGACSVQLEAMAHNLLRLPKSKRVVAVNNGAVALHALAATIDVARISRVKHYATQAFTFPCSAQGEFAGRTTIIDVTVEGDLDLDNIPNDCDGLVVTNVFGYVGNIERYTAWREAKPNRVLIFDNAASPMTFTRDGTNLCALGDGCIVSLHHTKPIGFGEGGLAIVDVSLEIIFRRIINFGYDKIEPLPWHPNACNGKMSEISAAFIIDAWEQRFEEIHDIHCSALMWLRVARVKQDSPKWKILLDDEAQKFGHVVSPSALCVIFDEVSVAIQTRKELLLNGIECRQYYKPLAQLPNAVSIYDRIVCIPCHIEMSNHVLKILNAGVK